MDFSMSLRNGYVMPCAINSRTSGRSTRRTAATTDARGASAAPMLFLPAPAFPRLALTLETPAGRLRRYGLAVNFPTSACIGLQLQSVGVGGRGKAAPV